MRTDRTDGASAQHWPGSHTNPASAESFAAHMRLQVSGEAAMGRQADERYRPSRLAERIPHLELPVDRPRSRRSTFAAESLERTLDAELVASLGELGKRHGAGLSEVLLTGFATLLRRLANQHDIVVGVAIGGRSTDRDSAIGGRDEILPLRMHAAPGAAFARVLEGTVGQLEDAFAHPRQAPGDPADKPETAHDPGDRSPLASVSFEFDQPHPEDGVRFQGSDAESRENLELSVHAVPVGGAVRLQCRYDDNLHDAASVDRWMDALETLLRSAIARPDCAWDRLEWLSEREQQAQRALQPQRSEYDATLLVHRRFAAHAAATPDRTAISFGDHAMGYAELDRRSNALAHALRERGVAVGSLVGVCLEREPDLYVAVLGILKAGAAFVPLDPAYPEERLKFMIDDAGLSAIVGKAALVDMLDFPRAKILALDADMDRRAWGRTGAPGGDAASAGDPAYVIYTSGSTGKPKGVLVPHRSLVNLLCSMQRTPGLSAEDRFVAVTTTSFDMSIPELFLPLTVGACIVLASRDDVRDGFELRRLLERSGATIMQATPSGWRVLTEAGWRGGPRFKALVGGESLPQDLAVTLCERCGELWNMYGPTETTVWSTCARVSAPEQGVSIGTPMANTSVWVLDAHGGRCPIGVPGEIWIGGDGVTLGYLNRPQLTAERFVADPFSGDPRARLYRTGDRGRWRNDGTLEHLGRLDFQVKVRGYRIEPGEVEANLAGHPDVAQCMVLAREDRPGDMRLVGYFVARPGTEPDEVALQEYLRARMPDYMVPQHLLRLHGIPLSANGKIDRKALPAPGEDAALHLAAAASELGDGGDRAGFDVDPRIDYLVAMWSKILGVPVHPDDNFFELGGNSILAVRMIARIKRDTGVRVRLIGLAAQSLAQVAAELPASFGTSAQDTGVAARLARGVRRMFGRRKRREQ